MAAQGQRGTRTIPHGIESPPVEKGRQELAALSLVGEGMRSFVALAPGGAPALLGSICPFVDQPAARCFGSKLRSFLVLVGVPFARYGGPWNARAMGLRLAIFSPLQRA